MRFEGRRRSERNGSGASSCRRANSGQQTKTDTQNDNTQSTQVRKSFDARRLRRKEWVYVVDVPSEAAARAGAAAVVERSGRIER